MKPKTRKIIGWVFTAIIGFLLAASAVDKITLSDHAVSIAKAVGIPPEVYLILGIVEIVSALLFANSRTGILGALLLSAYFGGAIATHLQHQQGALFPMVFAALTWITAVIRFSELLSRILNKPSTNKTLQALQNDPLLNIS